VANDRPKPCDLTKSTTLRPPLSKTRLLRMRLGTGQSGATLVPAYRETGRPVLRQTCGLAGTAQLADIGKIAGLDATENVEHLAPRCRVSGNFPPVQFLCQEIETTRVDVKQSTAGSVIKAFFNQCLSRMCFHSAGNRQCAHAL